MEFLFLPPARHGCQRALGFIPAAAALGTAASKAAPTPCLDFFCPSDSDLLRESLGYMDL